MKEILNPRVLAITNIITAIIEVIASIILIVNNNPLNSRIILIIGNILGFVLSGRIYIIVYLIIILKKKQKNIKLLNIILFINFIIAILNCLATKIIYIINIYNFGTIRSIINIDTFIYFILDTLFLILETLMVYGILTKKNLPYKRFTIILIALIFIDAMFGIISIIDVMSGINSSFFYSKLLSSFFNFLSIILVKINSCSFILFMYLYGKSISEKNKNDEYFFDEL